MHCLTHCLRASSSSFSQQFPFSRLFPLLTVLFFWFASIVCNHSLLPTPYFPLLTSHSQSSSQPAVYPHRHPFFLPTIDLFIRSLSSPPYVCLISPYPQFPFFLPLIVPFLLSPPRPCFVSVQPFLPSFLPLICPSLPNQHSLISLSYPLQGARSSGSVGFICKPSSSLSSRFHERKSAKTRKSQIDYSTVFHKTAISEGQIKMIYYRNDDQLTVVCDTSCFKHRLSLKVIDSFYWKNIFSHNAILGMEKTKNRR